MNRQSEYQGVYATIDFPPYKYQEFPKVVYMADGDELVGVAQNAQQYQALLQKAVEASAAKPPTQEEIEKQAMLGRIAELEAQLKEKTAAEAEVKAAGKVASPSSSPPPKSDK